ncbi:flagellar biosynthesis protein a [Bacillus stratosphericus LAMA 585]|nr:flagellar biosynthesis protein a [Bacillus stratosphericus LAMA 585]
MMIRIRKTTRPTSILPPTTNDPNVSTTLPASPVDKIERVVEMLSPKRNSVKSKSNDGKMENCSGSCMFIVVRSTISAREILIIIKILNRTGGNGMTSIATIKITLNKTDKSLADMPVLSF